MSRHFLSLGAAAMLAVFAAPHSGYAQSVDQADKALADARKAESKADSRLAKARKNLAKSEKAIAKANDLQLASGERGQVAASDFRALCKSPPAFVSSRDAQEWARTVAAGAKRWTDADAKRAKGGKNLERATRDKDEAEADIIRAQAELDRLRGR